MNKKVDTIGAGTLALTLAACGAGGPPKISDVTYTSVKDGTAVIKVTAGDKPYNINIDCTRITDPNIPLSEKLSSMHGDIVIQVGSNPKQEYKRIRGFVTAMQDATIGCKTPDDPSP
jgi:hypothetical protein